MSEYIKKEDLFNKTIKRNSIWNKITNAEGKGLEEIVNDLPTYSIPDSAENKREWIPVSERLPEKYSHVLVSVKGEPDFVATDDYYSYGFDDWKDDVTAWMPAPEPYKGGEV